MSHLILPLEPLVIVAMEISHIASKLSHRNRSQGSPTHIVSKLLPLGCHMTISGRFVRARARGPWGGNFLEGS